MKAAEFVKKYCSTCTTDNCDWSKCYDNKGKYYTLKEIL